MNFSTARSRAAAIAAALALSACGGSSSDTTGGTTAFPAGLALVSPTSLASMPVSALARAVSGPSYSAYLEAADQLSGLLDGTVPVSTSFDPTKFLQRTVNAECFGPTLDFSNHPDGAGPGTQLPSGDLGIWKETDATTGHACAPAEINARLQGVSDRSLMALTSLASMIRVANDNSVALPSAGAYINLVSEMNALGITGTTFTIATLSLDGTGATWSYDLQFTYTDTSAHDIVVTLQHTPGASSSIYQGLLSYRVDDQWDHAGVCSSADRTYNGTLYYQRSAATAVQVNAREGMYCGLGIVAATATDTAVDASGTYQLLDPATTHATSASTGWSDNFSILGAQFDPTTTEGKYTYAWQAGDGDGNSRVFSIGINYDTASSRVDGEAYYGFGDAIGATDGAINGFYCSWAAPGSTHTLQPYAQRQFFTYNATSGLFEVPAGGSDILYAPTNSCTYSGTPGGFWYDRDLDHTANELDTTIYVYASGAPAGYQDLDLMGAVDTDADGTPTITEKMGSRGWTQPPM